jgi:hypothetical protein
MTVRAVVFDVGETLIDESRMWRGWAAYLGVTEEEFVAALEDAVAHGQHHYRAFDRFRPGFDLEAARRERAARGDDDVFAPADLYPKPGRTAGGAVSFAVAAIGGAWCKQRNRASPIVPTSGLRCSTPPAAC